MSKLLLRFRSLSYAYYLRFRGIYQDKRPASKRNNERITLIVPAVDKDFDIVPAVIRQAEANLTHELAEVLVVCPKSSRPALARIKKIPRVRIVHDEDISPIARQVVADYKPQGLSRAGWIIQQLIKLAIHEHIATDNYLVIDADTVLTRPQSYTDRGRNILLFSDEFHAPYRDHIRTVLGFYPREKVSFIAHSMLFNVAMVKELLAAIERNSGKSWAQALVDALDPDEISSMSEYEMYAAYVLKHHSRSARVRYWRNRSLPRKDFPADERNHFADYAAFRSASYHSYN